MSLEFMRKYIKCDLLQKKGPLSFNFSIMLLHVQLVSKFEPISNENKVII